MNRVGTLITAGVVLTGAAFVAAARWMPAALQPAGTRAELSRLMAQGVDELDSLLGEWPTDESHSVPLAVAAAATPETAVSVHPVEVDTAAFEPASNTVCAMAPSETSTGVAAGITFERTESQVRVVICTIVSSTTTGVDHPRMFRFFHPDQCGIIDRDPSSPDAARKPFFESQWIARDLKG